MSDDLISRQAAIDLICKHGVDLERRGTLVLALVEHKSMTIDLLESLPTADVVEVVRCKDCKHLEVLNGKAYYARCKQIGRLFGSFNDDARGCFCESGERRDDDAET